MQKPTPVVACVYNAFTTGNPFWGTIRLNLVWGGVLGGSKGVKEPRCSGKRFSQKVVV